MAARRIAQDAVNEITAQRAVFGERHNAHDLLASSGDADLFRRFPAIEVDLPADVPGGSHWGPFIRGWRSGERYYFAEVTPDLNATRSGMVRTQILAFSTVDVGLIDDLEPVFDCLRKPWTLSNLTPFLVSQPEVETSASTVQPSAEVIAAAEFLAKGPASQQPGAFIGQSGFAGVIRELWRRLIPRYRPELAFGFSFTPADLRHRDLHLVCTPAALADRWRTYLSKVTVTSGPESAAVSYLLGQPSADFIRSFVEVGELREPELRNLSNYVRAAQYWARRTELDLAGWISLAKEISNLSPLTTQSNLVKNETVASIQRLIPTAQVSDILAMRNLELGPFGSSGSEVEAGIKNWILCRLKGEPPATGSEFLELSKAWLRPATVSWSASYRTALAESMDIPTNFVAQLTWFLFQNEEKLFQPIAEFIPQTLDAEHCWAETVPAMIGSPLADRVVPWCRERGWWVCQAGVLLASKPWTAALEEHLGADSDTGRLAPVRMLIAATDPATAIDFCASCADARVRCCGAELAVSHPEVWARFDSASTGWYDMLQKSWAKDTKLLDNLPQGCAMIASIFDAFLVGEQVPETLLVTIGSTQFADLNEYPKRDALIAALPKGLNRQFLAATALGWIERFFCGDSSAELSDSVREAIAGPELSGKRFPPKLQNIVSRGVAFFGSVPGISETVFSEWIEAVAASVSRFSHDEAGRVAALLTRTKWEKAAFAVRDCAKRTHRADLLAIWDGYWRSLTWQDKVLIKLSDLIGFEFSAQSVARGYLSPPREKTAVFITALNLEFDAVCAHITQAAKTTSDSAVYASGLFIHGGHRCKVIVALAGMGNAEASLATERAIKSFSPDYAFLVGIAGGLKDDLRLGDVVVADKVYAYESGKAKEQFHPRPKAPQISYAAYQMANAIVRGDNWRNRVKLDRRGHPTAFVKPIAAGEKVVDSRDSAAFKLIAERYSDAYAVAMEDFGFVIAAHATPSVTFAAVRGISDFAHEKADAEKENSQEIAAANAAAFAFEMLAGFLAPETIE